MAAAYQSGSDLANGTRTNSTLTAPSGITNGDTLVIMLALGGEAPATVTVTPPSGFTVMTGFPVDLTAPLLYAPWTTQLYAWWKTASGESGNYTVTHASRNTEGRIERWNGCASSPINPNPAITDHAESGSGGTTLIAPTITPVVNDSGIIWLGITWDAFGAASAPTGTTPTFTERRNTSTEGIYTANGVLATAAATGTKSVTSAQAADRPWIAALICLEAAVAAATSPPPAQTGRIPAALMAMSMAGIMAGNSFAQKGDLLLPERKLIVPSWYQPSNKIGV